jgi:rhodanese-related sulfurtransferase
MKKLFFLFVAFLMVFGVAACNNNEDDTNGELLPLPETITMSNLDEFLFRSDTQYTDLRNFDDQMRGGWIRGFEIIPFFAYLEYEGILVREDGWNFTPSNIKDEGALRNLFDKDKNILLMCAAGVRAAYVKTALEHLGYENVWNIGALGDYTGPQKVFGDDSFRITMPPQAHKNPLPEVVNMENIDSFLGRPNTQFFDFRDMYPGESDPALEIGWINGFTIIPYFAFLQAQEILTHPGTWDVTEVDFDQMLNEDLIYVLLNLFDKEQDIILMCMSGARSGMMKAVLEHLGYENVWNAGGYRDYTGDNKVLPWCTTGHDVGDGDNGNGGDCE